MHGGSCKEVVDVLLTNGQPIAVLAGAGVSVDYPTGLPTARDFMTEALRVVCKFSRSSCDFTITTADVSEFINRIRFEQFIEVLHRCCDPDLDILDVFLLPDKPNSNHMLLATLLLQGHAILTTNFDNMIEKAVLLQGGTCAPIYDEPAFQSISAVWRKNPLFKLHGTVDGIGAEGKHSVRTTLSDIARDGYSLELTPYKRAVLAFLLSHLNLIVVGYSGCDDYDIVPLMSSIATSKALLWVDHRPGSNRAQIAKELNNQGDVDGATLILKDLSQSRTTDNCWLLECDTALVREALIGKYLRGELPKLNVTGSSETDARWRSFVRQWAEMHMGDDETKTAIQAELLWESGYRERAMPIFKLLSGSGNPALAQFAASHLHDYLQSPLQHLTKVNAQCETAQENTPDQVLAKIQEAYLLAQTGKETRAEQLYLSTLPHILDPKVRATLLGYVADLRIRKMEFEGALQLLQQCLAVHRELGDRYGESRALWRCGNCLMKVEKYQDALRFFENSLKILKWLNRIEDIARVLGAIGMANHALGRFAEAVSAYERSIREKEKFHDYYGIGTTYYNLAKLKLDNGQLKDAFHDCVISLRMATKAGDRVGMATAYLLAADILCQQGKNKLALSFLGQADHIAQRLEDEALKQRIQELKKMLGHSS